MRSIPEGLAAEFASGATTLCRCWRALRRDGRRFGFTDHDRDIAFDGTVFQAATGLEASEAESLLGLAVGGGEVAGALSADAVSAADIEAGAWDGAAVESWLVDWRDTERRMLLDTGTIGDIRRQAGAFTAELRSLAHLFDQERGRRYGQLCSAELGDERCRALLAGTGRRIDTVIASTDEAARFTVDAVSSFAAGAFTGGTALFTAGENAGRSLPILAHAGDGTGRDTITLWSAPPGPIAAGDAVTLTVGCDKRFSTCRDRFGNALNFRGFPHIPGNDFVATYARQGEAGLDGGPVTP
jgi:uncharacterized phage protein (TIGR02218 family)